ncbi:MAG: Unknown protein [uncultured Sulfurovum sp.]|uniref:Cytochrome c domain-containing protein n=1 Tax=uncultured Sulfurovum sp. TaxID=269237 RepID=A0A6S6T4S6_9BACT|nr:MAG: Unknown protein [uncultured Sulfurovum sp.]
MRSILMKVTNFNYLGDLQMKKIIIMTALLASTSLMATETVDENKSVDANTSVSVSTTKINGALFYKKRCSICHGENGEKTPLKGMIPIASMDASALARKIKAYRDQDERHGAYAIYEDSIVMQEATYSISDGQISAIATHISKLK